MPQSLNSHVQNFEIVLHQSLLNPKQGLRALIQFGEAKPDYEN